MRVVVDGRYAQPHFPGVGRYTENLVRALAETRGDEVIVLREPTQPDLHTEHHGGADGGTRAVPA